MGKMSSGGFFSCCLQYGAESKGISVLARVFYEVVLDT